MPFRPLSNRQVPRFKSQKVVLPRMPSVLSSGRSRKRRHKRK